MREEIRRIMDQLDYANKEIEALKEERNYWRQKSEDCMMLREAAKKNDKTKELRERISELEKTKDAYKGTIRGLEKTRDKLEAEVNRLRKKLVKSEQRSSKETVPLRSTLIIRCCLPFAITYEENIIIDGYVYDITRIEYLDNCSCKIYLMLNHLKTLNRRNNI